MVYIRIAQFVRLSIIKDRRKTIKWIIAIALFVFVLSLTQHAFCLRRCNENDARAWLVLLLGWMGIPIDLANIFNWFIDIFKGNMVPLKAGASLTWLANPLFLISLFYFKKERKQALKLSLITVLIMFSFLLFNKALANEAGHYHKIVELKLGYWLWLLSACILFVGNVFIKRIK